MSSCLCYLYGVLQPAIMDYFDVDSALASTPFTLVWMFMVLGEFLASPMQKRFGAKVAATAGLLLLGIGYFACSLLSPDMMAQLIFFYSVAFGLGLGITYNTVAAVSVRWFPDHKGAASSVSLGMMGAAGIHHADRIKYRPSRFFHSHRWFSARSIRSYPCAGRGRGLAFFFRTFTAPCLAARRRHRGS